MISYPVEKHAGKFYFLFVPLQQFGIMECSIECLSKHDNSLTLSLVRSYSTQSFGNISFSNRHVTVQQIFSRLIAHHHSVFPCVPRADSLTQIDLFMLSHLCCFHLYPVYVDLYADDKLNNRVEDLNDVRMHWEACSQGVDGREKMIVF